jgi:hypothetical protein
MLVRGVVERELDDHLHPAIVRRLEEGLEVVERAVGGIDLPVVRDVIAVVSSGETKNGSSQRQVTPRSAR